jgi:hypothetical protein
MNVRFKILIMTEAMEVQSVDLPELLSHYKHGSKGTGVW